MQQRITLTNENIPQTAQAAASVIRNGGCVLYPTDTLYGLGVDTFSKTALELLYSIKGRDEGKSVHSVVSSTNEAKRYVVVTDAAQKLADKFLPGKLTLIMSRVDVVPSLPALGGGKFGIRIPDNQFCLALARELGTPYTATSANKSGMTPERDVDAILEQLAGAAKNIDLIIDGGTLPKSLPTTVVDTSVDQPHILREGAIPTITIANALAE